MRLHIGSRYIICTFYFLGISLKVYTINVNYISSCFIVHYMLYMIFILSCYSVVYAVDMFNLFLFMFYVPLMCAAVRLFHT